MLLSNSNSSASSSSRANHVVVAHRRLSAAVRLHYDAASCARLRCRSPRRRSSPMGMTIVEKILTRAAGGKPARPGDIAVVGVDVAVLIDTDFFPSYWRSVRSVAKPENIVVIF